MSDNKLTVASNITLVRRVRIVLARSGHVTATMRSKPRHTSVKPATQSDPSHRDISSLQLQTVPSTVRIFPSLTREKEISIAHEVSDSHFQKVSYEEEAVDDQQLSNRIHYVVKPNTFA